MEDKLLSFIKSKGYASSSDIYSSFQERRSLIALTIQKLINDGRLIVEDGYYVVPSTLGLLLADIITIKEGFSFARLVETNEEVYIQNDDLEDAIAHDRVYLRPNNYGFHVVKIVQRKHQNIVGEIVKKYNKWIIKAPYLISEDRYFIVDNYQGEDSDLVVAHIVSSLKDGIHVEVDSILGKKNEPGMDMKRLLLENDAPIIFPPEVENEVLDIPLKVSDEEIKGRLDLRDKLIFTIDGEDARDLDDAISIEREQDDFIVGVHIADVSYYVKEGSYLDKEALNRGTSIYIASRVIPMLPFQLSNGICSLNPHVDRLTISCLMKIDKEGHVLSSKITPSVICSKHRLTYTYVNEVIEKKCGDSDLNKTLLLLHELTLKIASNKKEKGTLDLNVPEIKIEVDENGTAIGVHKKIQKDGEKLIEELMILANEAVSETIYKKNIPFIYRIHEKPPLKKMMQFVDFASKMGHPIHFNPLDVTGIDLQKYLDSVNNVEKKEILSTVLLRSLAKACYSSTNKGHFGLASSCYTHFTSPIRRYPDLIVHRLLRKYLFNNDYSHLDDLQERIIFIAEDTSSKERRAISIERKSIDIKGAEYMENHLGAVYHGYIEGMNNKGMFVELDNGLSGVLKFNDFSDYFSIDEHGQVAYSRRKGIRFVLGEKVNVIVAKVNKMQGEIVLNLLDDKRLSSRSFNHRKKRHY